MNLKEPKTIDFLAKLSTPSKYIPYPAPAKSSKVFSGTDAENLEFINKISLPRKMAECGHKKNFVYSFCNCSNGDDHAEEGRNFGSLTKNGFFKIK